MALDRDPMIRDHGRFLHRAGTFFALVLATSLFLTNPASASVNAPSPDVGATSNRAVPETIRQLPLINQAGQAVNLASWPGKTVLLVPFLTLCSDICPFTTGDLFQVEHSLHIAKAASRVEIVELSVDPERDTPARLAAYAKLTGASWQLVTETPAERDTIDKFFGFFAQQVPQDTPPAVDWWTGQPLTYDVSHSDGFIVINPKGIERFVTDAAPNFHGKLNPTLKKFLSALGRQHLAHPTKPNYTPADILQALAWSMQVPLLSRPLG